MVDIDLELLPQTKRFRKLSLALIFILSVASCIYPLHAIKERDIVYFFLYNNPLSLYLQTFILLIIFGQILKVRPIAVFLGIRQAETGLVKKLLQMFFKRPTQDSLVGLLYSSRIQICCKIRQKY